MMRNTIWALGILLSLAFLSGCRDTPAEVLNNASEAAHKGDLVALEESFSVATIRRLEVSWNLKLVNKSKGWTLLAEDLLFNKQPLKEGVETIVDDFAMVIVETGGTKRDYYLRKEDGLWRIELGARSQFLKVEAIALAAAAAEEKED